MKGIRLLLAIFIGLPLFVVSILPLQALLLLLHFCGVKRTNEYSTALGVRAKGNFKRFIEWE
jgi:hypothetical protein